MTASATNAGEWTLRDAQRWTTQGTGLLDQQIATLTDRTASEPTALPGWTGKHLLAHVCANAEALGRLVRWAATGVPTPMYASATQRQDDIDLGATCPTLDLLAWFGRSTGDLAAAMEALSEEQWRREVVTAQGRTVPATTIPWLRAREVMVHAVDLGTGVTFADLPADFLAALAVDIVAKRNKSRDVDPEAPALELRLLGARAEVTMIDDTRTTLRGDLSSVAALLAGRSSPAWPVTAAGDPAPPLGPWL